MTSLPLPAAQRRRAGPPSIDLTFLLLAAGCLVVGVSLGVYMGVMHDHQLAPVHVHLNLLGWASLAIFGLAYRAYPTMAGSRLARLHLALSGSSALLFPFGLYMSFAHGRSEFIGIPALMWLAGSLTFLIVVARATWTPQRAPAGS